MKKTRKKQENYGMELTLDLYECCSDTISSKKKIQEFSDTLCDLIKMVKFKKALIPYFGRKSPKTAGYSLVQLIETSSITGHFSEHKKAAYINIFSCKKFDPIKAADFTKAFFKAKRIKKRLIHRV